MSCRWRWTCRRGRCRRHNRAAWSSSWAPSARRWTRHPWRYAKDAGADRELAEFFREAGEQNERRAQRALQLLARHAQK